MDTKFIPISLAVRLIRPVHAEGCEAVEMSAVLAEEIDAPEGQRPIRWVLLSSLPAESFQEAMRIVRGYIRRWRRTLSVNAHAVPYRH